jgi:HD superfamily phosphodiesterase
MNCKSINKKSRSTYVNKIKYLHSFNFSILEGGVKKRNKFNELDDILSLNKKLSDFVQANTKYRDYSHNYSHMKQVAINSIYILVKTIEKKRSMGDHIYPLQVVYWMRWCLISAWLHDIADHKYDIDGTLKQMVDKFIYELTGNKWESDNIKIVIESVSFSSEARNGYKYYENLLNSDEWIMIRNIVSDSDKIEALGSEGIKRCTTFSEHTMCKKLTEIEKIKYCLEYTNEKLLFLADYYIHTDEGKIIADYRTNELIIWFEDRGYKLKTF